MLPHRTSLALAALAPLGAAQELLDTTYHFARLGAETAPACGQDGIVTRAWSGEVAFAPDGTFALTAVSHGACPDGSVVEGELELPAAGAVATYELGLDGVLALDFGTPDPVPIPRALRLSWDRRLAFGEETRTAEPAIFVAVAEASGAGPSLLHGEYGWAGLLQERSSGIEVRVDLGSISFDGAGGSVSSSAWRRVDGAGASTGVDGPSSQPYGVSPDGALTLGGSLRGAVSPDGRLAFALETAGPRTALRLLVREVALPPTPGVLSDTWWFADYGGRHGTEPCGGVEVFSAFGHAVIDGGTGKFTHEEIDVELDCAGGTSELDVGLGHVVVDGAGAVTIDPIYPHYVSGWMARSEDVIVYGGLNVEDAAYFGAILRGWGPLAGSVDELSASAGGAQHLDLRAGHAFAGETYLVVGTMSGTWPGTPIGDLIVPLNSDTYTDCTLVAANQGPLVATLGSLDAQGDARARIAVPPGAGSLVGVSLRHAALVLDAASPHLVVLASNPVGLELVP